MKRHRPGMICLIIALTLVFSMCNRREQADKTDTSTTATTDTTMTVPPDTPVAKVEATPEAVKKAKDDAEKFAERDRKMHAILSFEEFKGTVYKEPFEGGKWLVNGDTAIADVKQLEEFYEKNVKPKPPPRPSGNIEFAVNVIGGLDDKWNSAQQKQLTYCVSTTFGGRQPDVVAQMEAATAEWEKYGNLDFIHVAAQDSNCDATNTAVVFDVRPVNVNRKYLARAFFPNELRPTRNVLIDESSFQLKPTGKLQLVGILRHELGHAIGARHEQTRPEAGACFEDTDWRPLTSYDAFSVMHYPQCNGRGDWSLTLTEKDKSGVACLYGPASGFTMDPTLVDKPAKCATAQPVVAAGGQPKTDTFAAQTVAKGAEQDYGPFPARAGSAMEARIGGASASGDPDLYVKFDDAATVFSYDCRPYTSGANETCSLTVPATATEFSVMVRGYAAGKYDLTVTHTP